MDKTSNKCPSCRLGHRPGFSTCPKCNKPDFLDAVKKGMDPFDHMKASRLIWIAIIAALGSLLLITAVFLYIMFQEIALGNLTPETMESNTLDTLVSIKYPNLQSVSSLIGELLTISLILIIARKYLSAIISTFKNYKNILKSLGIFVVVFGISMGWNLLAESFLTANEINQNQVLVENALLSNPVVSLISTVVLAPCLEELAYRCGIFNLIRRKNTTVALIVSTVIFALIHLNLSADANLAIELISAPNYLLAGFALGFIYHKYGFACSFLAHAFNNLVVSIFVLAGI